MSRPPRHGPWFHRRRRFWRNHQINVLAAILCLLAALAIIYFVTLGLGGRTP